MLYRLYTNETGSLRTSCFWKMKYAVLLHDTCVSPGWTVGHWSGNQRGFFFPYPQDHPTAPHCYVNEPNPHYIPVGASTCCFQVFWTKTEPVANRQLLHHLLQTFVCGIITWNWLQLFKIIRLLVLWLHSLAWFTRILTTFLGAFSLSIGMEWVFLCIPKINPTKIVNSIGGYEND